MPSDFTKIPERLRDIIEVLNNVVDFERHNGILSSDGKNVEKLWHYLGGLREPKSHHKDLLADKSSAASQALKSGQPFFYRGHPPSDEAIIHKKGRKKESELWFPLILDNQPIGILLLGISYRRSFSENSQMICQGIVNLGINAGRNPQLEKLWEKLRYGILHRKSYFSAGPKLKEVFSEYLERCHKILPYKGFWSTAWLVESDISDNKSIGVSIYNNCNQSQDCTLIFQTARKTSNLIWKRLRNSFLIIPEQEFISCMKNINKEPAIRFPKLEDFLTNLSTNQTVGTINILPAIYEDQVVALFTIISLDENPLDVHHIYSLAALITNAAPVIANTRTRDITEKRRKRLFALYKTSKKISESYGLDQVLQATIDGAVETIYEAESGAIIIWRHYKNLIQCLKKTKAGRYKKIDKPRPGSLKDLLDNEWKIVVGEKIKSGICVDLESRGLKLGALCLYNSTKENIFRKRDKQVIYTFASHAAEAIHNALISEELHELGIQISQEHFSIDNIFKKTVQCILNISTAKAANMLLLSDIKDPAQCIKEKPIKSIAFGFDEGFEHEIRPRKKGITYQVLIHGKAKTTKAPSINKTLKKFNIKAYIGLPMNVQEKILGVLFIHYDELHKFTESEIEMLSIFANSAAALIKNRLSIEEIESQTRKLRRLRRIIKEIESNWDLRLQKDKFLDWLANQLAITFESDRSLLLLFDSVNKKITGRGRYWYKAKFVKSLTFQEIEMGISGKVLKQDFIEKGAVKSNNAALDQRHIGLARDNAIKHKTGPLIVCPIWNQDDIIGTLTIGRKQRSPIYTELDRNLAVMAASDISKYLKGSFYSNL